MFDRQLQRRRRRALALAVTFALLAGGTAFAQSTGAQLAGAVKDPSGAVLPGASVTVKNSETGLERTAASDSGGNFRFPALPPGTYDVTVSLDGFTTVEVKDVVLNVATPRSLDVSMQLATVSEEIITVADSAPLIRTDPSIGTVVSTEELENLPLNGRQFASLGSLAAGTSLSYNTDPTKPGQQTIALNGGIGRNVNYIVDGGDNMDDTIGGALQNFSIEAVQEFKIQTMQYKAEYGRSTGGVLAVVTKTGTNDFDGSVFEYARRDELNSKTEAEKRAGVDKQPFERDQYGASIGGPIVRDKAHFFAVYEKTERAGQVAVDTGGIFPELDGTVGDAPFEDELFSAKASVDLSAKQYLQVRYGYQKNTDKYSAIPTSTPDNWGTLVNENNTALLGHTIQLGPNAFNEALFQYADFENAITSDSTNPLSYFPSGVATGQNNNTPQSTIQEKRQFKDELSFSTSLGGQHHDFKTGIEYIDEPVLGGDFPSGLNGAFSRLTDDRNSPVREITFNGGSFNFSTPNEQWRLYFQDDWQVSDNLTLNLGLRYDYTDVLELDQRSNAIWQTLSTQTQFNEYYLQDFQGGKGGEIEADDDDFAPRLGFTWDLSGDGQKLLRGGAGRFYDFPYTNATVLFPTAAVVSTFGVVYNHVDPNGIRNPDGSFFQPGQPLPPNQIQNPTLEPAPNEVASPTLETPYSDQLSLGYSHQINPWLGFSAEIVSIDYEHIPYRFRANPRFDSNGDGVINASDTRRFADFGNFRLWYGDGEASYDGLNLSLRGRVSSKLEFQAFYTYSETDGNVLAGADEFRITDAGAQPSLAGARDVSPNPLDPQCDACFGPLNTDAKHRVTISAVYRGPWDLVFSGIVRYRSAQPYTSYLGVDANGDGFNFDLAPGEHVNQERGSSFSQVDVRVSKEFTFGGDFGVELIAEVFNLFNDENPTGFIGNQTSANFGEPTAFAGDQLQGEQRLAQLGLRFRF